MTGPLVCVYSLSERYKWKMSFEFRWSPCHWLLRFVLCLLLPDAYFRCDSSQPARWSERPTLLSVLVHMCAVLWASFPLFAALVVALGLGSTPHLNTAKDGVYFGWCVLISWTYALALLALRKPTLNKHDTLPINIAPGKDEKHARNHEIESLTAAFGPGDIAPSTATPRVAHAVNRGSSLYYQWVQRQAI